MRTRFSFKMGLIWLGLLAMAYGAGCSIAQPLNPILVAVEDDRRQPVAYKLGEHVFQLEVARTQDEVHRGLMYRKKLPENGGMLFPFYPPRPVNFWMKNTLIPLDMIFIRDGRVVHIQHNATPCKEDPCPTYSSVTAVDTVVELPGGTAKRLNIDYGTKTQAVDDADGKTDQATAQQTPTRTSVESPSENRL